MRPIQSKISTLSADYRRYEAHNRGLIAEFRARQDKARHARAPKAIERLESQLE